MPDDIEAIAGQVFAALADPTRRAILAALASRGPATATGLAVDLPITWQAIAKHLALLAGAGLVMAEPGERRRVRYRLRSAPMQVAQQFLAVLAPRLGQHARRTGRPSRPGCFKDHPAGLLAGRPQPREPGNTG